MPREKMPDELKDMLLFRMNFKGHDFMVSNCGSSEPLWLIRSFALENELREQWWNINPGDVVIDIGAAYGSYTITALAQGASKVIAIEPSREDLYDLCGNLVVNNWSDRCILINAVAGPDNELMAVDNYYPESHSFMTMGNPESRLCVSVDYLVDKYNIDRVDWIKIDVDGSELDVLEGCKQTIDKFHPALIIENHVRIIPDVDQMIRDILAPLGYAEENIIGRENTNENWSKWTWPK